MEYFNFSHLPLLVKEMIADEIVHNSIPEDRIQFATTCKAFNQLVKHAKPKKIIRDLRLHCRFSAVIVYSENERDVTLSELKKISQQCQVENLSLCAANRFTDNHLFSELMDLLMEPCRFVTALSIDSYYPEFKYVDFYKKLKHLKLVLRDKYSLPMLAEKTLNHPLSFLDIDHEVQLKEIQRFLMTANLEIGAEIRFRFEFAFHGFLTFIGNGLFEFEIFRKYEYLILDQQMNSQNKKVLKLSTDFWLWFVDTIPFTVISVSNPDNLVFPGKLTTRYQEKIISDNVAKCVKISFLRHQYSTYYSPQLLDNWFPRTENYDPFKRVKTINKTLGTNIVIITPEMFEKKVKMKKLLSPFSKRFSRLKNHFLFQ